ncbi:hypothetical protein F3K43_16880 [Streptomyces sp. LBUM 1476]|uniref:Uncharacterized protein n=1 Tax=Streptomyces acidiscabies TaxID=42234 RepID=A0AAP6BGJ8_9ACTN|nr:hypothetical protein [Streptomyces acidiscabies]MBP5937471.1 hypothetical protein [Streptomyces sp. LBUM 1476]MBZ3914447.1 hypothetical protein [Streptomyces acidiscabies]MDX2964314.1 hypothetical protein [Streptomyces acidiscabies]MDX3017135.1 hypothetical protein [Streptomyces acidiscabies]MDX3789086.1 hypothetical protein [Streptomyces acidiscabies]
MTTNWAAFHTAEPALAATVEARFALQASYVKEVEPPEPFHLFRVELTDVTRTFVEDETYLVVELWEPGKPLRTIKRR